MGTTARNHLSCNGNGNAAAQSNSAAVFDTADGFQGVWHLGETGGGIAKDATANHYDGTPSDTAPASVAGTIGLCRSFNGSSNFIRMNGTATSKLNFPENGIYTISAWAYADTLDDGFHLVVGKSDEQYYLKLKQSVPSTTMRWEFVEYHDKAGWFITNGLPSARSGPISSASGKEWRIFLYKWFACRQHDNHHCIRGSAEYG